MINEWIREHRFNSWLTKRLICKDGFEMSVQASNVHYCSPRIDNATYYTTVEVGFPTTVETELIYYAEDRRHLLKTVYSYVPVELVEKIINKHGVLQMINACLLVSKTTYEVWNIYCDNESRDEIVTYCFDRITNKELPHKSDCHHRESYSLSPTDNGYHFTWWRND